MEIYGTLEDYFEAGPEGIWWAICRQPSAPIKGIPHTNIEFLDEGDYLEIYSPDELYANLHRRILWSGYVKKDKNSHMTSSGSNPRHQQQSVCGRWVHWLQDGFSDHEQWGLFFFLAYPAKLVRR